MELNDDELSNFYENKTVNYDLINNQYILLRHNNKIVDKYRYINNEFIKVKKRRFKNTYILPPLDEIQRCAYDMLFNDDILCCCLTGRSGTGKTKTALSVGLELLSSDKYEKLIIVRHAVTSGKDIGFLKGSYEDKLLNWAGCIIDNLPGDRYQFEELINKDKIQIESVSHIKGRNYKNSFVIFEEAEDSTPLIMEIVGTRNTDSCKFVCVGDYLQASSEKFMKNSGLLRLINKAKGKKWFGCIELKTNGRGELAEFFSTEYKED